MGRGSWNVRLGNSEWAAVADGEGMASQNLGSLRAAQGRPAGRLAAWASRCVSKGASGWEPQASCLSNFKDTRTKHNRQPRGGARLGGRGGSVLSLLQQELNPQGPGGHLLPSLSPAGGREGLPQM